MVVAHIENTPVAPSKRTELDLLPAFDELVLACLEKVSRPVRRDSESPPGGEHAPVDDEQSVVVTGRLGDEGNLLEPCPDLKPVFSALEVETPQLVSKPPRTRMPFRLVSEFTGDRALGNTAGSVRSPRERRAACADPRGRSTPSDGPVEHGPLGLPPMVAVSPHRRDPEGPSSSKPPSVELTAIDQVASRLKGDGTRHSRESGRPCPVEPCPRVLWRSRSLSEPFPRQGARPEAAPTVPHLRAESRCPRQ